MTLTEIIFLNYIQKTPISQRWSQHTWRQITGFISILRITRFVCFQIRLQVWPKCWFALFVCQSMWPDLLQQITERCNHGVLFDTNHRHLATETQCNRFGAHFLQQHSLGLCFAILFVSKILLHVRISTTNANTIRKIQNKCERWSYLQ